MTQDPYVLVAELGDAEGELGRFARQDSGAPLGPFRDGLKVASVPADDTTGELTLNAHGFDPTDIEVLVTCPNHPDVPAVDCGDCW